VLGVALLGAFVWRTMRRPRTSGAPS